MQILVVASYDDSIALEPEYLVIVNSALITRLSPNGEYSISSNLIYSIYIYWNLFGLCACEYCLVFAKQIECCVGCSRIGAPVMLLTIIIMNASSLCIIIRVIVSIVGLYHRADPDAYRLHLYTRVPLNHNELCEECLSIRSVRVQV